MPGCLNIRHYYLRETKKLFPEMEATSEGCGNKVYPTRKTKARPWNVAYSRTHFSTVQSLKSIIYETNPGGHV